MPQAQLPIRLLYVLATLAIGVFMIALFWFIFYSIGSGFQSVGAAAMTGMGTNSTTSGYVNTFMTNIMWYGSAIGLIVLVYWAWAYSQQRGRQV